MKTKEEIFHDICKPYSGFVNVINNVGGSTIMMLIGIAMQEYSDQTNAKSVEDNEKINGACNILVSANTTLQSELSSAKERVSELEAFLKNIGDDQNFLDYNWAEYNNLLNPKQH